MKKLNIVVLVVIAVVIALLISQLGDFSTYETIKSARAKESKTVTVIAKLDKNTLKYDPVKNPNYMTFQVIDTLGDRMPVAYYYEKPTDMEKSERIVLKGKMDKDGIFQIREQSGILLKCPSKYKDDPNAMKQDFSASR